MIQADISQSQKTVCSTLQIANDNKQTYLGQSLLEIYNTLTQKSDEVPGVNFQTVNDFKFFLYERGK